MAGAGGSHAFNVPEAARALIEEASAIAKLPASGPTWTNTSTFRDPDFVEV